MRRDSDSPLVELSPWVPALERLLVYETQTFTPGSKFPVSERKNLFWKVEEDGRTYGYFTVGMLRRVMSFLKKAGYTVEATDSRDRKRYFPEPHMDVLGELRFGQKETIDAIVRADCGLVVCPTGFGKSFIISKLTQIYPKMRFLIVAPGVSETKNLYDRIHETTEDISMLSGTSEADLDKRILVSTSKSFLKADLSKIDMFVFDEAHGCGNNKVTQDILDNLRGARIFGFTATPTGRSDKSDMLVEALFGPPIVNYSYKQAEEVGNVTPILVQMWDVPGKVESSRSPYGNAMTQNKRRFYWNNEPRNRLIQALARLVPPEEQVLIMTDTVEHLVRLGALLPEFTLICGLGHDLQEEAKHMRLKLENRLGDNKAEYDAITAGFKNGSIKRVIATFCWKQAVDFPQLSVLIRADGAKSVILGAQIPGRMSRLSMGKEEGLLIDFTDGFNTSAKRKAEFREKSYRKTGWKIEHMGSLEENLSPSE